MNKTQTRFEERLLAVSVNKNILHAYDEWVIHSMYESLDNCLCGRSIKNIVELRSKENSTIIIVGTTCVDKFFSFSATSLFKELKDLRESPRHFLSLYFRDYFKKIGLFNDWEYDFYANVEKYKNRLSTKQIEHLIKINNRIVRSLTHEPTNSNTATST